jgi:hypothetical protein
VSRALVFAPLSIDPISESEAKLQQLCLSHSSPCAELEEARLAVLPSLPGCLINHQKCVFKRSSLSAKVKIGSELVAQ